MKPMPDFGGVYGNQRGNYDRLLRRARPVSMADIYYYNTSSWNPRPLFKGQRANGGAMSNPACPNVPAAKQI